MGTGMTTAELQVGTWAAGKQPPRKTELLLGRIRNGEPEVSDEYRFKRNRNTSDNTPVFVT